MRQGPMLALVPVCLGLLIAPAFAGSWALPDDSRGTRVAPMLLLTRADVREDLLFPPDQVGELEKAVDDLHKKAAALKGKTGAEAVGLRKAVDDGQKTWLEAHLTPDQVIRLYQIDLRWEGPVAIVTRPTVAEDLALSTEQKSAFNRAVHERNAHVEKTKDHVAADRRFAVRTTSILNESQKLRWEEMIGRPILNRNAAATLRTAR